jgi:uncharacterized protein YebE (UPF0316 family)
MIELFAGPWGPFIIFLLRIIDVSLATLRILLTMRDQRTLVPLIGVFEALVWVLAVGTAIQNLNSPIHILGYAGGFAGGTVVGLWIEGKLALGLATIRIISRDAEKGEAMADALRERGYGVTEFAGEGRSGKVQVIYMIVKRRQAPVVIREVEVMDKDAFITVEEPRAIRRGWVTRMRKG